MVSHKTPGAFVAFPTDLQLGPALTPNNNTPPLTGTLTSKTPETESSFKDAVDNRNNEREEAFNQRDNYNKNNTNGTVSNSGQGIESALGTSYSWDTKAEERADLDYKSAVLETKQQFLTNRQDIDVQGQEMQNQFAMQQYSQNQSNEKAGWTGGYILDTERQMAFLKQTIQSQMYGAMELQKYGYDTSLAAARLAYDTNKYDLALEYYNTALSRAVSEAEITGYYVSPEAQDMINQYNIAVKNMEEGVDTDRAQRVMDSIDKWFEANGISKQGVETITHKDFIFTLKEAAKAAANFNDPQLFKIDVDSFGEVDENGNLQYSEDNSYIKTKDFDKMTTEQIIEYAKRGAIAQQQVMGYFDGLIEKDIHNYLNTVKVVTGEGDNKTTKYNVSSESLQKYIDNNSKVIIEGLIKSAFAKGDGQVLGSYALSTEVDGTPVYIKVGGDGAIVVSINTVAKPTKTTVKMDGLDTEKDELNNTASNRKYTYRVTPEGQYIKTGYNATSTSDIYDLLKEDGYKSDYSTVIDISKEKSEWGNYVKQEDFSESKSKGDAGAYVDKIIADAKAGKIEVGDYVQFNYGNVDKGNSLVYVYVGNNRFARVNYSKENSDSLYIPDGYYMKSGSTPVIKKN